MANTTHFEVDESLKGGRNLMDTMRSIRATMARLNALRNSLVQEKDTGTTGDAVFAKQATLLGYAAGGANNTAQSAAADSFSEIDAAWQTAYGPLQQLCDKHLQGE